MESDKLSRDKQEFAELLAGASQTELTFIRSLLMLFIQDQGIRAGGIQLNGGNIDFDLTTN